MNQVIIFADTREGNSNIFAHFEQFDCRIEKKMLLYGDFLVSDRVCIERKTTDDFVSSILDKRLFQQMKNMKDNFEKPILIIEGESLYGRLQPNAIRGALAAIAVDLGVPIIWTKDLDETAGMIYWLARREQLQESRPIPLRDKKKTCSVCEEQEFLIHGLPGVSITRSKSLLKHFKTPLKIFKATEKELAKVEGIGKKTAKRIVELLTSKYE